MLVPKVMTMMTYDCRIRRIRELLQCHVDIDYEGLGPVRAVVVLAVGGGIPHHLIVRDVTPSPKEGGKTDIFLVSCRPDRLHPVLNNQQ